MIKAVLFDCFGVIFSPAFLVWVGKNARGEEEREQLLALAESLDAGDISLSQFQSEVGKVVGQTLDEVGRGIAAESHIDQDVVGLIRKLKRQRCYRIGILSNINAGVLTDLITDNWLEGLFDITIASSTLRLTKPDHRLFRYALQRLGFGPQEVVFVDDTDRYVAAAGEMEMRGILFHSADQLERDLQKLGVLV